FGAVQAKTQVLVSIAPQKFLVEQIGGAEVEVSVIVPAGANSHTYEPTPRQVIAIQKGEIWFRIGESFEARMIPSLHSTQIVDQREGLDLIKAGCGCCNARDACDPHIWLSPRLLKTEAAQIAEALAHQDPAHGEFFKSNYLKLAAELE